MGKEGSKEDNKYGEMPEWLMGADCKSAGLRLRGFESLSHQVFTPIAHRTGAPKSTATRNQLSRRGREKVVRQNDKAEESDKKRGKRVADAEGLC